MPRESAVNDGAIHTMRRALLIGYYGYQNAGDDAFLAVSAWGARKFLGVDEVWANTSVIPPCCLHTVRPLGLPASIPGAGTLSRLRRRWLLPRFDHVIFGGGSNFHTSRIMEDFIAILRAVGPGPHFALGVSLGPFRDETASRACANLLSLVEFVGVRDQASLERAHELDPAPKAVEYTFDIAPLLAVAVGENLSLRRTAVKKALAVSLCNYEQHTGGERAEEIRRLRSVATAIQECAREGCCEEVILVDMNGHPTEGDGEVHALLRRMIEGHVTVRHEKYTGDPLSTLRILGEARGVLAMRLHAAVFAFSSGTPFAMIAYHEKCVEWMRAVGGPDELLLPASGLGSEAVSAAIRMLMGPSEPALPSVSVSQAIDSARKNWERARECVLESPARLLVAA